MSRVALVLVYDGNEPTDYQKSKIAEVISKSEVVQNAKGISIYFMNEKEVISAVAAKPLGIDVINKHFYNSEDDLTPEEMAVVYVGTKLATAIRTGVAPFSVQLAVSLVNGKDEKLIHAIKILSVEDALMKVRDSINKKYGFYPSHYAIIQKTYASICQEHIVVLLCGNRCIKMQFPTNELASHIQRLRSRSKLKKEIVNGLKPTVSNF